MKAILKEEQGCLLITGDLSFGTVSGLLEASLAYFQAAPKIILNLSHVKNVSSAALALVIEWIRYAQSLKKPIQFLQVPKQLFSMAEIAGIHGLLL